MDQLTGVRGSRVPPPAMLVGRLWPECFAARAVQAAGQMVAGHIHVREVFFLILLEDAEDRHFHLQNRCTTISFRYVRQRAS